MAVVTPTCSCTRSHTRTSQKSLTFSNRITKFSLCELCKDTEQGKVQGLTNCKYWNSPSETFIILKGKNLPSSTYKAQNCSDFTDILAMLLTLCTLCLQQCTVLTALHEPVPDLWTRQEGRPPSPCPAHILAGNNRHTPDFALFILLVYAKRTITLARWHHICCLCFRIFPQTTDIFNSIF